MSGRAGFLAPVDLGVPGPTGLDMARAFRAIRADPVAFLTKVSARYGDTVAFPVPGRPLLLLNDPRDATQVLQTHARQWGKDTTQYRALERVTGPGLLATSGPDWITHRRIAAPAFHRERLHRLTDRIEAVVTSELDRLPIAGGRAVVDVAPVMDRLSLTVMGTTLFSDDFEGESARMLSASRTAAATIVALGRSVVPGARWLPTPTNARIAWARRSLLRASRALLVSRAGRVATPDEDGDLLGLLLDSGLSEEQIHSEIVTMMIAGHETVGAALAWMLMLLAQHPQAQERVREEATRATASLAGGSLAGGSSAGGAVAGGSPAEGTLAGSGDDLAYTKAVIDESLRLYPSAWVLTRRAVSSDSLSGVDVPSGTQVIISPWLLHRRPTVWEHPETFDPTRFLGGPSRRVGYLPFGQGPRLCIGREMALGQMGIVAQRLLERFDVRLPPGWRRPRARALVSMHPDGGMPLVLERRGRG